MTCRFLFSVSNTLIINLFLASVGNLKMLPDQVDDGVMLMMSS